MGLLDKSVRPYMHNAHTWHVDPETIKLFYFLDGSTIYLPVYYYKNNQNMPDKFDSTLISRPPNLILTAYAKI